MNNNVHHDARVRRTDVFTYTATCTCGWSRTVDHSSRAHFIAARHIDYS